MSRIAPVEAVHRRRLAELDGLRGLLALSVVFHHATVYPLWLRSGVWERPGPFSTVLGSGGVAVFFMITGFLFWSRLLAAQGRLDWLRLWVGRLFRIVPVYLLAVGCAVLATFALTRQLNVSWAQLLAQVAQALAGGFLKMPWINNYESSLLMAGVTWSLQWEWGFYAALLPLSLVAARRAPTVWLVGLVGVVLLCLLGGLVPGYGETRHLCYVAEFGVGMLAGSLRLPWLRVFASGLPGSAATLGLLVFAASGFDTAEDLRCVAVLGAAFVLVVHGASLFGLLRTTAFRRLGEISYAIYLLHGLVLALVFRPPLLARFALSGPAGFACLALAGTGLAVLLATAAHLTVERPGQALGVRFERWMRARWRPASARPA